MRAIAVVLALALLMAGCGEDEPLPAEEPEQTNVCNAVSAEAPEGQVEIEGEVTPLSDIGGAAHPEDLGFVLTDGACSIFVAAPGRSSVGLGQGERVSVRGSVSELDEVEAERIARILDLPEGAGEIEDLPGEPAPVSPGDPFLDGFSLGG